MPKQIGKINTGYDQTSRVHSVDGDAPTITTPSGGGHIPMIKTKQRRYKIENVYSENNICKCITASDCSKNSNNQQLIKTMRFRRSEEGKKARQKAQRQGKDYTPFGAKNRELVETDAGIVGNITSTSTNRDSFISHDHCIRRLTPLECERLQGYDDNYTKYGKDENGKIIEISDTQRYRMMGNAVSTVIPEIIAKRLFGLE